MGEAGGEERYLSLTPIFLSLALLAMADPSLPPQPTPLETGYLQLYDLQFGAAHLSFQEWARLHPGDPMAPVSEAAAYLFSEFDRLHILQSEFFLHDDLSAVRRNAQPDPAVKQSFYKLLAESEQLADNILHRDPQNQNAEFATVMRLGLQSDYLALIEKRYLASLSDVKAGRALAEKLIASNPAYCDAYLAIGVENYLLSLKSAPLRWLLRADGAQTDKNRGIEDLEVTAKQGHYLMPYARILLAVAALRDHAVVRARELLQGLAREFPDNPLYSQELARMR